jgi:hypothetical protein
MKCINYLMATSEIAAPMLFPSALGHSEEFHSNMDVGLVFAVDPHLLHAGSPQDVG